MTKSAHELTRKEMKGPDRFQVAAAEAAGWMANRQKQLAIGAVALLAILAAALGVSAWMESSKAQAGSDLYAAIDAASGEVSPVPVPGSDRPVYPTAEQKDRAALAAAERVRQRHGGARAAVTATLVEGDAHLELGSFDKAAAAFQAFLEKAPDDDSLRFAALDGLARAQEGKGDLEGAARTWERAAGVPVLKDRAVLERARVLAKAGKTEEARKALEAVAKDSPLAAEVQERLARLGGK